MPDEAITQSQLDSVAGLPSREAAAILGVGKTTINKYRGIAHLNGGTLPLGNGRPSHKVIHEGDARSESIETKRDGSLDIRTESDVPQTKSDVDNAMIKRGFDPEEYSFTYRFSEWDAQRAGGEMITMYAARAGATPRKTHAANSAALDVTELLNAVSEWDFAPIVREKFASVDMGFAFADPQLGKTDKNGGTDVTVEQVMASIDRAVEIAKEEHPRCILWADLGDGLENFNNTAQQRETNDLDLTSQVRLLRRLQAEGIRRLAPLCEMFVHACVPSNHGQVRVGFQSPASVEYNDWGVEVSHQLEDVFTETSLDNLHFSRPLNPNAVAVDVELPSGTLIGLTHGDKAGSQNRIGEWWMRQAFGFDNPLREVDILLYGHFHNQMTQEVSEGRWAIGCASSDRGSAWFENKTGQSATSGITTFLTASGKIMNMQII